MPLPLIQDITHAPIRHTIAIAAGKGGVGKSTVSVHMALSLKKMGYSVGLLDGDLYGPSLRRMLPEQIPPEKGQKQLIPALCCGIKVMTLAYFHDDSLAAAWRAPLANRFARQLFTDVQWGPLDYLLVDFPPGTGDLPMTLCQSSRYLGALLVTTPQQVALQDVLKAHSLFKTCHIPTLGVVENMAYFKSEGGLITYPFGKGAGLSLAETIHAPLLGTIPLDPSISSQCDEGYHELTPHPSFLPITEYLVATSLTGSLK